MADHDRPARYHAYLLRCWQERSHDPQRPTVWRFSLEDPHTGARSGYATLNAVIAAVQHALSTDEEPGASPDRPPPPISKEEPEQQHHERGTTRTRSGQTCL
jgi:hypothetical protein